MGKAVADNRVPAMYPMDFASAPYGAIWAGLQERRQGVIAGWFREHGMCKCCGLTFFRVVQVAASG